MKKHYALSASLASSNSVSSSIRILLFRVKNSSNSVSLDLQMRVSILDCPVGYVYRLRTTPTYDIATRPSMMSAGLLPILKLTWKAKVIIFAIYRWVCFLIHWFVTCCRLRCENQSKFSNNRRERTQMTTRT